MKYRAVLVVEFEYDGIPNAEFIHEHAMFAVAKAVDEGHPWTWGNLTVGLADVFEEKVGGA